METTIPAFGPRELVMIGITLGTLVVFMAAAAVLIFSKAKIDLTLDLRKRLLATKNSAVAALIISGVLLAFMFNVAVAQQQEQWVYLGPGYDESRWNFRNVDGSTDIAASDVVTPINAVNIRADHFGNLTGTWLGFVGKGEPEITGVIVPGECALVIGFKSVGFNKVWMRIEKVECG